MLSPEFWRNFTALRLSSAIFYHRLTVRESLYPAEGKGVQLGKEQT